MVPFSIPATEESYDALIPRTLSVSQVTHLLSAFFVGMIGGAYMPDDESVLCSMKDGRIYHVNSSVESLHLKNGSKRMLI